MSPFLCTPHSALTWRRKEHDRGGSEREQPGCAETTCGPWEHRNPITNQEVTPAPISHVQVEPGALLKLRAGDAVSPLRRKSPPGLSAVPLLPPWLPVPVSPPSNPILTCSPRSLRTWSFLLGFFLEPLGGRHFGLGQGHPHWSGLSIKFSPHLLTALSSTTPSPPNPVWIIWCECCCHNKLLLLWHVLLQLCSCTGKPPRACVICSRVMSSAQNTWPLGCVCVFMCTCVCMWYDMCICVSVQAFEFCHYS